jgi:hypothetical protein
MRYYRQLKAIGGTFVVIAPSPQVKLVIDLCHLDTLLFSQQAAAAAPAAAPVEPRRFTTPAASFELIDLPAAAPLTCETFGNPTLIRGASFSAQDCRPIQFPAPTFGLGLGAFGHNFDDARGRFGEFLAVAGSAAYLPTDGTNVPDFMVSNGDLVPEVHTLYGLRCTGAFSHLLRFESPKAAAPVSLSAILRVALELLASPNFGVVLIAESAGLVGAALRRSPAAGPAAFHYPEIRDWLSFSTERLYSRSLALVSGFASTSSSSPFASFLRPLTAAGDLSAHLHAAAFSYRPLPKGAIDLKSTVTSLFESENLQGVLHLLTDDRGTAGPQESDFVRGACWLGPIAVNP